MANLLLATIGPAQRDTAQEAIDPAAKRPPSAAALFAAFAKMPGLEACYTEKKHLSLLAVPLESNGRLYFLPPGYLARVAEAPEKSTLTITPKQLTMKGRDGTEVFDLQQSDRVRLFVTSLVRVFRGDRETLEQLYAIDYAAAGDGGTAWRLRLVPRGKPLTHMMKSLTLDGTGVAVERIELVEPSGDRTVTTITARDAERKFDDDEKAELFGIATPHAKQAP